MKIKSQKAAVAEVNMTPMIDIVFQLIAFFMLVTNFEQTQADERVKLPKDELARPPEVAREDKRVFNIGFERDRDGNIVAGVDVNGNTSKGPFCYYDGKAVPISDMGKYLIREARILAREDKLKDTTVIIRADKDTPTGRVQEFMKIAQTLGNDSNGNSLNFTKFALAATQLGALNR